MKPDAVVHLAGLIDNGREKRDIHEPPFSGHFGSGAHRALQVAYVSSLDAEYTRQTGHSRDPVVIIAFAQEPVGVIDEVHG